MKCKRITALELQTMSNCEVYCLNNGFLRLIGIMYQDWYEVTRDNGDVVINYV